MTSAPGSTAAIRALALACLLVLPVLPVTACARGASTPGAAQGASRSSHPTAATVSPSSAPTSVSTGEDLCALVSVQQAAAALATDPPITTQAAGTFVDGEPECGFASQDSSSVVVDVTLFDAARNPFSTSHGEMNGDPLTPVTGLGDQAGANSSEVDVAVGDHVLSVEAFSGDVTADQLTALARVFSRRL